MKMIKVKNLRNGEIITAIGIFADGLTTGRELIAMIDQQGIGHALLDEHPAIEYYDSEGDEDGTFWVIYKLPKYLKIVPPDWTDYLR